MWRGHPRQLLAHTLPPTREILPSFYRMSVIYHSGWLMASGRTNPQLDSRDDWERAKSGNQKSAPTGAPGIFGDTGPR